MSGSVQASRNVSGALLLVALAVFPAGIAAAQSPAAQSSADQSSPSLNGIAHVAIRVSDLERSRAFFHKLGYQEAFAMDKGGTPTEAFFKINDRQFIELYPRRQPDDWVGFMHICFESPDLNAVYQDYIDHGLTPTPVRKAGAGNLLFTLQGPVEPGQPSDLRGKPTQNIEYTQYMPGSRHTLDRGKHLGADRVADRMAGVAIPVQDVPAATEFYQQKLSFKPGAAPLEPGSAALSLPGAAEERIEFLPESAAASGQLHFRILFSVPDVRATAKRLRSLGFQPKKRSGEVEITDPDGDQLVFIHAE
jgi:catechol 2,3-dioxygenase-like lactoylglutathione lyase family enzyme